MKLKKILKLPKEAELLGGRIHIIKSVLAIFTAYVIGQKNEILKLDMISVLFGLMLTLQPVAITGIRMGLDQIFATIVGSLTTTVIIYSFGINRWTIGISMGVTLYVCMKINWRNISAVAIFSCIYMTQYIQYTPQGRSSIYLTFKLRIIALLTGIIIAEIYNGVFGIFIYKSMIKKRIIFIIDKINSNLNHLEYLLKNNKNNVSSKINDSFINLFKDIDLSYILLKDIIKEREFIYKMIPSYKIYKEKKYAEDCLDIMLCLEKISYISYDMACSLMENQLTENQYKKIYEYVDIKKIVNYLENIKEEIPNANIVLNKDKILKEEESSRVVYDFYKIEESLENVYCISKKMYKNENIK